MNASSPRHPAVRDRYLTPAQAAELLGVCTRTIVRWANFGRLPFITTLGGHRRFLESDVLAIRGR